MSKYSFADYFVSRTCKKRKKVQKKKTTKYAIC